MRRTLFLITIAGALIAATFAVAGTSRNITVQLGSTTARVFSNALLDFGHAPRSRTETILLLGESGAGWTAGELTDTLLLLTLDPVRHRATMFSIPRDLLVQLPGGGTSKINALWLIGKQSARRSGNTSVTEESDLIRAKLEEITGVTIDDVAVIDVAGLASAIDALQGIAINVQEHIDDPAFPTPGGGIEHFILDPGFQILNGTTAVKYARTRHTAQGDFGRVRRQQQVIEAMVAKARGLDLPQDLATMTRLYASLAPHVETTLTLDDALGLASLTKGIALSDVRTFAVESIGKTPLLMSGGTTALLPRAGAFNYTDIRAAIADLLQ